MLKRIKEWRQEKQEINALNRHIRNEQKRFKPHIDQAERDEDYKGVLIDTYVDAVNDAEIALAARKTASLTSEARKLGIDISPKNNDWYWERITLEGRRHSVLSSIGELKLRRLIRKEKREDRDWWIKVLSLLIGVLGLILGIITTLKLI